MISISYGNETITAYLVDITTHFRTASCGKLIPTHRIDKNRIKKWETSENKSVTFFT
jgi:hypothetical protein